MKWVHASVVAVMVGVCTAASAQSIPAAEPGSVLLQSVQYGGPGYGYNYGPGYDGNYNAYGDRGYGYRGGSYNRGYGDRRYRDRYRRRDDGAAVAAGVVGLAVGAAIAGSANQRYARSRAGDRAWIDSCSRRYRSFDPASGTYVGFDGYRHSCR